MDALPDISPHRGNPLIYPVAIGIACIAFWTVGIPYAAGHGDGRERIITWLIRHWSTATWFHGAIVPFGVLAMGWKVRTRLQRCQSHPSNLLGLAALVVAFLFLWVGYRTHVVYIGLAGIQFLIAGLILWNFGREHLRTLLFPFFFLLFAWPLPFLEASLSFHLRIGMTEICTGLINLCGGEVTRQGTALAWFTPSGQENMEIEGACSGLRSLFSLIAASALYGFFVLRRNIDRTVLMISAVVLAVAGNVVRILMLFIGVHLWGWETAIGSVDSPSTFHMAAGILAIATGLGGIVWVASLLKKRGKKTIQTRVSHRKSPTGQSNHSDASPSLN